MRCTPITSVSLGLLFAACPLTTLRAVEALPDPAAVGAAPVAPPPPAPPSAWTRGLKVGVYASAVAESNAETSRDGTISSAQQSVNARGKAEGFISWTSGRNTVENKLLIEYGQEQNEDAAGSASWEENVDQVRYDGVFRRTLTKPAFLYLAWGLETNITGPAPEEAVLDPGRAWVSTGYGHLYEDMFPQKDRLEWRLGVRGQQHYSFGAYAVENRFEVGPEGFLRYERTVDERLSFFGQYEVWSEFIDLGHVTNLITAGLTAKLAASLTAELALRAYYEGRPGKNANGEPGYDEWSLRQDTMLGLVMEF